MMGLVGRCPGQFSAVAAMSQAEPLQTPRQRRSWRGHSVMHGQVRRFGTMAGKVDVTREQCAAGVSSARASADEQGRQVARILESITDAFLALDLNGRFTYLNRAARRILADLVPNPDDLIGQPFATTLAPVFEQFAEQYKQLMIERQPLEFETYYAPLERWFEVHAYPSEDGGSVCFRDITARKRDAQSLSLLAEMSAVLARSLDYATTLSAIVRLSVPSFADHCVVFLKGHDGGVVALEAKSSDPRDQALLDRAVRYFLQDANWDDHPIARVLRTGGSELMETTSSGWLSPYIHD